MHFLTNQRRLVNFLRLNFAGFSNQKRKTRISIVVMVVPVVFLSDGNLDNWGQLFFRKIILLPYHSKNESLCEKSYS